MQWKTRFLHGKFPQTVEIKKPWGLRPINLNPFFKIKLHRFTWPLFTKDLLSSTYNLIYVRDPMTSCCSLVYPLVTSKGLRSLTQDRNIESLNERLGMM